MFYFDNFNGKKILKSSLLQDYDCFFTTRDFPLTAGALENIEPECSINRLSLKKQLGVQNITTAKQVHGCNIEIINKNTYFYDNTDALISNIPSSLMLLNYADCVPIILYSKKDNTGSIIHAGWRGCAAEITAKTADRMIKELNIHPENITALIGPSIGKCCFETDEDVFLKLIKDKSNTELYTKKGNKFFIDLKMINKYQLLEKDIHNIDISDYCTCCMSDIFFSYRKEKGITARHSAIVKIKGDE